MQGYVGDSYGGVQAADQRGQDAQASAMEQALSRLVQVQQQRKLNEQHDRQMQFMMKQHQDSLQQQEIANAMAKAAAARQASQDDVRHQEFMDSLAMQGKIGLGHEGDTKQRINDAEFRDAVRMVGSGQVLDRRMIRQMWSSLPDDKVSQLEGVFDSVANQANAQHQAGVNTANYFQNLLELEKQKALATGTAKNQADAQAAQPGNFGKFFGAGYVPVTGTNATTLSDSQLEQFAKNNKLDKYSGIITLDPKTKTILNVVPPPPFHDSSTNAGPQQPFSFVPSQLGTTTNGAPTTANPNPVINVTPTPAVVPQPAQPSAAIDPQKAADAKELFDWANQTAANPRVSPADVWDRYHAIRLQHGLPDLTMTLQNKNFTTPPGGAASVADTSPAVPVAGPVTQYVQPLSPVDQWKALSQTLAPVTDGTY